MSMPAGPESPVPWAKPWNQAHVCVMSQYPVSPVLPQLVSGLAWIVFMMDREKELSSCGSLAWSMLN